MYLYPGGQLYLSKHILAGLLMGVLKVLLLASVS